MGISVTRAEFLEASLSLLKTMSPEEKHEVIFPRERESHQMEQDSMGSSKHTLEMAKRSGYDRLDIYNRGLEHRKNIEEKNEKHRENRARDELKQCTFRPILKQPN
jgi:hypothetical protein